MSRLEELLKELCPDGVEYKKLGEVASISRGGSLQKKDFCESGVPCLHYGQIYTQYGLFTDKTLTYINENVAKKQRFAEKNDIVMAVTSENIEDVCKCVAWLGDERIAVSGHTAIIHHTLNPKYLSYYFYTSMFFSQKVKLAHGTKVMEVTPDKLTDIILPVPPLEVQEEIVRILDEYTDLKIELKTKLTSELNTRKQQYEYYRDELLSFSENECEWKSLNDICDIKGRIGFRGYTRNDMVKEGEGAISLSPGNIINQTIKFGDDTFITWEKYNESPEIMLEVGDVILCKTGSTLGKVALIEALPEKATINPQLVVFKEISCNNRYLKYFLSTFYFQNELQRRKGLGSVPNISQKELGCILIPVPSKEKQERIVSILDRFDKLCNDISEGISAEIEARQKQYEYYRDKLLSFKEVSE